MDIQTLLNPAIQEFIHANKSVDINQLGLQKIPYEGALRTDILQQIKSYQKARIKLPHWIREDKIIYPAPDLIEQASSSHAALYKASICPQGDLFLDLSAGTGSDTAAFAQRFQVGHAVDANETAAQLLRHNLPLLGAEHVVVHHGNAEVLIDSLPDADFIFIDPARRESHGRKGLFNFTDTAPDVTRLLPRLIKKSPMLMIKASPYLDITEGMRQLGGVSAVHVVESGRQCREVLYIIEPLKQFSKPVITAVDCDSKKTFTSTLPPPVNHIELAAQPDTYLYEPATSLLKASAHDHYAATLNLQKLAPQTHLYTSDKKIKDFMGRVFQVLNVLPVDTKSVSLALPDKKANISVKNFPMDAAALRRKLKLKDGGQYTLYGCTLSNGKHQLLLCEKSD